MDHVHRLSSKTLTAKTRQTTTDASIVDTGTSSTLASQPDTRDNAVLLGVLIPFSLILIALAIFGAWLARWRWRRKKRVTTIVLSNEPASFDQPRVRGASDDFSVQSYGIHEAEGKVKLIELGGNPRAELEGAYARG